MTTQAYPRCAFTILLVLSGLLSVFAFPWPPPMTGLVLGWVALAGLVGAGLFFGRDYGLGAPYLGAWCARRRVENRDWLRLAAAPLAGLVMGGLIVAWIRWGPLFGSAALRERFAAIARSPRAFWWAAVAYSGVTEEIVFRLFLLSLVVWVLRRNWLPSRRWPLAVVIWIAILVAALAFGAAHLSKWSAEISRLPSLAVSILLLNGIVGTILGYLYRRFGLEVAILCHFGGDFAVYILGPRLF
jgi:Type II CAAX prenyl endopeptidase Rce1-like